MSRCDIIIPVWDQLDITRECVDSIIRNTDHPYRLIIIDNGSQAPTRDYLLSLKDDSRFQYLLIRNDKNLGFVKAVNQGILASNAPYICIMNNDTIAASGWLSELMKIMEANLSVGLLNPSSNTSCQFPGSMTIEEYGASLKSMSGQIQELYTCRGFCMIVRREVLEKVGLLDEVYYIGYFDDADYCKRSQKLGYKIARAKAAYVYHRENVSFKVLGNTNKIFDDNKKIFFKRWGRDIRVCYLFDNAQMKDKIDKIAINTARSGHQITIFMKRGLSWPVSIDHFDIRRADISPFFYTIFSLYKIIKRKKKKNIEIVLTDNAFADFIFNNTKKWHGAEVLSGDDMSKLESILQAKSRIF